MKLSETVKKVIRLAAAMNDYWDTELPKWHPRYPIVQPGEDSPPPPPEEKRLRDLFESLSDETIFKIALIMNLGRHAFDARNLSASYQTMKERYDDAADAASQMIAKSPLADYLADGLTRLKKDGVDVDKLPLKQAVVQQ